MNALPDNAASRLQNVSTGRVNVMDSAVSTPSDQTGSSKSGAASPETDGDSGIQAAHEKERQKIEKDEIHRVQDVLVVLLDVGYADDVDVAGVQSIADGFDVEESGRSVHGR